MKKENTIIKILWLLPILFIIIIFINIAIAFFKDDKTFRYFNNTDKIESWVGNHFTPQRQNFVELYGFSNKLVGREIIDVSGTSFITLKNGSIIFPCDSNDMKYQIEEMMGLSNECQSAGIDLLYVNCPMKPQMDGELSEIGYPSYFGYNTKTLLDALCCKNIDVLDMRQVLNSINSDFYSWFYKTEHHWTTSAGFICARSIVDYLNTVLNHDFDVDILNEDNYYFNNYKDVWLGENGRKLSLTYSGLDDYTFVYPKFKSRLNYNNTDGDFRLLVQQKNFKNEGGKFSIQNVDLYNQSLHYSYLPDGAKNDRIHNYESMNDTKILFIIDSFGIPVVPFVSLACSDIYVWDNRSEHEVTVKDFVRESDFDVVVVMYCEGSIYKEELFDF